MYAARLSVELEKSYTKAKRIILRDVSRTDRNYHFFRCVLTFVDCMHNPVHLVLLVPQPQTEFTESSQDFDDILTFPPWYAYRV